MTAAVVAKSNKINCLHQTSGRPVLHQLRWAGGVVLALSALQVTAQQTLLPPVEVIGSYNNAVGLWDAASQGAITKEVIEKRPLLRPGEVLETVPGVIVTQHSGDGKANQFFARGYNLDHGTDFATWVAGMPVNMPSHAHGQGYTDLNFMIPELVSRVVYNKGPYFAEDGDFSSVGSARIHYAEQLVRNLASLTGGQYGYGRVLLAGSPEAGQGRIVYGLEYQHNDGPWEIPNRFAKWNAVLRYAQGTQANGYNVTAMANNAHWFATDQVPLRAVTQGLIGRFGTLDPTNGGTSSRYSLSGEWRQSEGHIQRAANVFMIRSALSLVSNFTYALDNPVNGDQFEQSERRLVIGGAASQTWDLKWGGLAVSNTLGVQARRDRLGPVSLYATQDKLRLGVVREDRVTVASIAPYGSNTIVWNPWLRSIAGLRMDNQWFDVTSNTAANSGKSSASLLSPKLTLAFGPWQHTEYFLNAGRGFHSNDARGTTISIDPKSGAPSQRVTPLARTTGYEFGVRSQPLKGLTASAALWRLKQDSELVFVGDAGATEPSRPSARRGLELLTQYVAAPWLTLDASYAVTQARFSDVDAAGNHIPGAPARVASGGVTVENANGWFGALRWRYFGARPLIEDNSVRSRSTSLVNARVGYAFSRATRLQLDVFNVFDRKASDIDYYYASQLRGEAAPVADIHFHPVERRSLRLTLNTTF